MSLENTEDSVAISIKSNQLEINDNNDDELSTLIKVRNFSADTFTPLKIKDLSSTGKKNMGWYGMIALTILFIILALDLYGLINNGESALVIINVMIPITVALLSLEKLIALILHIVLKQFK